MSEKRALPCGWEWAQFDEVARVASNLTSPLDHPTALHIAPNHIESRTGRLLIQSTVRDDGVTSAKHAFTKGQVLYSKIRPYLMKAVMAPRDGLCSADMYPLDTALDPSYLLHWLLSTEFTAEACQHQGRSLLPKINVEALSSTGVPVPPFQEQRRIVAELERRLSHVDAAIRYLQSCARRLAAARFSIAQSLVLPSCGGPGPDGLPALPTAWAWSKLGDVATVVGGVTKDAKRQGDHTFVSVPYLRVAHVQRGHLELDDVTMIRVPPDKAKALRLEPGDVLFTEGGDRDKLGRGWVWEGQIPDCIHQNHVFRARLAEPRLDPKFVSWVGNTFGKKWFEAAGKQTTNLASVNKTTLESFPVPLPRPGEAAAIVREIERRHSLVDAAEAIVTTNLGRAIRLRASLLASAFAGRLVPQDPSDEPAAALLERIKASRSEGDGAARRRLLRKEMAS